MSRPSCKARDIGGSLLLSLQTGKTSFTKVKQRPALLDYGACIPSGHTDTGNWHVLLILTSVFACRKDGPIYQKHVQCALLWQNSDQAEVAASSETTVKFDLLRIFAALEAP